MVYKNSLPFLVLGKGPMQSVTNLEKGFSSQAQGSAELQGHCDEVFLPADKSDRSDKKYHISID